MSAMLGKAVVSNKLNQITKGLGLDDKEEEENQPSAADLKKIKKEELQKEEEKKKREEIQAKRRAERAGKRDEIREKYGLKGKESETSVKTANDTNAPTKKTQVEDKKSSDKCYIM
ncbi:uncharacterized protein [Antedon mediterranea]|uniref:uncharacterized protein n=1 Tax=Antedon mediterranea TaxID=105859 RepID=UPI003AF8F491